MLEKKEKSLILFDSSVFGENSYQYMEHELWHWTKIWKKKKKRKGYAGPV